MQNDPTLGNGERDAVAVVVLLACLCEIRGHVGASGHYPAVAQCRQPRVRCDRSIDDGRRRAVPRGDHDVVVAEVRDLDLGAETVKAEPPNEVAHQRTRQVEQEALAVPQDEEVEQDLSLRRQQRPIGGGISRRRHVGRHENGQERLRVGARDGGHATP